MPQMKTSCFSTKQIKSDDNLCSCMPSIFIPSQIEITEEIYFRYRSKVQSIGKALIIFQNQIMNKIISIMDLGLRFHKCKAMQQNILGKLIHIM